MKINYQTLFLLLIALCNGSIFADTKYYEQIDPFTDQKVFYFYSESIVDDFFSYPAYVKVGTESETGNWLVVFNSDYMDFPSEPYETVEVMVRFDKNPPFSTDLLYCRQFDSIEDCLVHDNKRDPSNALFTVNYNDFIERFVTEFVSSETLTIKFPGEQPITFNLEGTSEAIDKFDANFQ